MAKTRWPGTFGGETVIIPKEEEGRRGFVVAVWGQVAKL